MKGINRLSDRDIKNLKPRDKVVRVCDGGRLWVVVQPTGKKTFRLLWREGEKQRQYTIGDYPGISLKDARAERDRVKGLTDKGIDPNEEQRQLQEMEQLEVVRQSRTCRVVAEEWYEKTTTSCSDKTRKNFRQRLDKYVLPFIGDMPIAEIKYSNLLPLIHRMEDKNIAYTARVVSQLIGRVFAYAKTQQYVETNEATDLTKAVTVPYTRTHRAAITEPREIGLLLRCIDEYKGFFSVSYALKIMPYVFLRSNELRRAEWSEIDFEKAIWTVPAKRMKKRKEHVVPLSKQVIGYLSELRNIGHNSNFIFPSTKTRSETITGESLLMAMRRMGYSNDEMCIHGFRSLASTRLNEMGVRADVIEAQLAHSQGNAVRAAYNRAEYLEERTEMMQKWADYLDELREHAPA